jgi:sugar/nucleoside kinase (ribokinase family)
MPDPSPDVVGIGLATLDQIGVGRGAREPVAELSTFSLQAGGPTATALATIAAFGVPARFFGRLGDDEFGRLIIRHLRGFGVDTASVLMEPGRLSPVTFTLIDEETRRRTVRFTRGDVSALTPGDLPATLFDRVRLLYVDGEMPDIQIVAAERARARGARVLLDARHVGPGLGELLHLADVVVASELVAAELAHSSDVERSLVELVHLGPEIAVITLGDEGAVGLQSDTLVRQQALRVEVLDVTGAGAVFRGAFAWALLQGRPLDRALPFANAAAGLNCASLGGQAGIPSLEAVERAASSGSDEG